MYITAIDEPSEGSFLKQSWRLQKCLHLKKNSRLPTEKFMPTLLKIGVLEKSWRLRMPVGANWSVGVSSRLCDF
jgi:hypothetical protein